MCGPTCTRHDDLDTTRWRLLSIGKQTIRGPMRRDDQQLTRHAERLQHLDGSFEKRKISPAPAHHADQQTAAGLVAAYLDRFTIPSPHANPHEYRLRLRLSE